MKTDVIILNYNDYENTLKLATAIMSYESIGLIVIVDNCSTDDSLNHLKSITSDRVHVIVTDKNGGYGYGNNYAVKYLLDASEADYFLIANPDTYIEDECIFALMDFLETHKSYAVCAPLMLDSSGNRQIYSAIKIPGTWKFLSSFDIVWSHFFHPSLYGKFWHTDQEYIEVDAVSGSLFLCKRDAFIECGMFDEDIFLYFEEICLAKKLRSCNYREAILLNEFFYHFHSLSINKTYSTLLQKRRIMLRSGLTVFERYFEPSRIQRFAARVVEKTSLFEAYCIGKLHSLRHQ